VSPIARLRRSLNVIVERVKEGLRRDADGRPRAVGGDPEPMPAERSSVANVMAALVEARARVQLHKDGEMSASDAAAAMDVVNAVTDKVTAFVRFISRARDSIIRCPEAHRTATYWVNSRAN
jgi:hypothetical protein